MDEIQRSQNLSALPDDARRRLVETGTRNRLVHVNRSANRAKALGADFGQNAIVWVGDDAVPQSILLV